MVKAQGLFTGCSKRPSSKAAASEEARRTLRYVEPLSDARTTLADFFSILLDLKMFAQGQALGVDTRTRVPCRRADWDVRASCRIQP